ncbi:MAG: EutN/CcmL family microcompartment protein [Candidatus Aureabacteria bacterium]|nr:EutN/CcmL family microcompartment protein [Candidatus Auribacterota bacterium]
MKVGRVIGTVVASKKVESLTGVKLLLVQPLDEEGKPSGEPVVACDSQQSGPGETVFYIGGREASLPLPEPFNPADATITGIIDTIAIGVK